MMANVRRARIMGLGCLIVAVAALAATAATAAAAPALKLTTLTPDHVTAGKQMLFRASVQNVGTEPLSGTVTVRYELPPEISPPSDPFINGNMALNCHTEGQVQECSGDATGFHVGSVVSLESYSTVAPDASGALNGEISVSGGGDQRTVAEPFTVVVGPSGPFDIKSFDVRLAGGADATRAASAPDELTTDVALLTESYVPFDLPAPIPAATTAATEHFRDVDVHVPPGLVGDPSSLPRCTPQQLTTQAPDTQVPSCPPESQVGLVNLNGGYIVGLYNMVPPYGSPAAFGFFFQSVAVTLTAKIRPTDHGIDVVARKASSSSVPIPKFETTLWGNPSDSSHDNLRGNCLSGLFGYNPAVGDCSLETPDVAFLRTPTSCTGTELRWGIDIDTWENVGDFVHADAQTPSITGCDVVPFTPSFSLAASAASPHTPAGVTASVSMPQDHGPKGLAQADLRRASVTLAEGFALNPASAGGLVACSDGDLRLGKEGPADCPEASKLGTVSVKTPLLDHPVGGSVFLRSQNSSDPASGELFRVAMELRSDVDGIAIRLPGAIQADPQTGRLTTTFDNTPQLPFEEFRLQFKSGPRAALSTPTTCGTYTTLSRLESWSGKTVELPTSFDIDEGCHDPRFNPRLKAGSQSPVAGEHTPFTLRLTRDDDDDELKSVSTEMPEGLLAELRSTTLCADAQVAADSCPANSRIGSVTVGAGAGPTPFYVEGGRAYITGPYKGAPFGLAFTVPAVAGPFDLGNVTVRAAVSVDPVTAKLKVVSDQLPTIVKGVPLKVRDVRIAIDRPGFIFNPTDCSRQQIGANVTSVAGRVADLSAPFAVTNCAALGYRPKLALRLSGKRQTTQGKHPRLTARVLTRKGDANTEKAKVTLPLSLALDPNNAAELCEHSDGLANRCPAASIIGRAKAISVLHEPLRGPVYFVKGVRTDAKGNKRRTLPTLLVALKGEGVQILVRATSSVPDGKHLVTTFNKLPDAPFSQFNLRINGGKHGILAVTKPSICNNKQTAQAEFDGQNGKAQDARIPVKTANCAKTKKSKKR